MTKTWRSHGSLNITNKLCCLGAPGFWMVSQVLPILIGAVSQPCTGREGWRRWLHYIQVLIPFLSMKAEACHRTLLPPGGQTSLHDSNRKSVSLCRRKVKLEWDWSEEVRNFTILYFYNGWTNIHTRFTFLYSECGPNFRYDDRWQQVGFFRNRTQFMGKKYSLTKTIWTSLFFYILILWTSDRNFFCYRIFTVIRLALSAFSYLYNNLCPCIEYNNEKEYKIHINSNFISHNCFIRS